MARRANRPVYGLDGLGQLARALKNVAGGLDDLKTANRAAAEVVAEYAVGYAPVESGDMAATIRHGGGPRSGSVMVGTKAYPYGGVINWGYVAGDPFGGDFFMQKAARNHQDEWTPAYAEALEALITKHLSGKRF